MTLKQQLGKLRWKNFLFLTIAGMVNAFGVTMFIAPVDLYDSGISGTSILLSQLTPEWLSLSFFLMVLNIPLFLYGLRKQGVVFTIYAIYTVCAIFGGLISGIGSGMAIRFGGAMDGIEVLAVIFAKRLGITVGTFVMAYNLVLYIICGFVIHSWILPLYSIVTYGAALKTVDFIVEGLDRSKAATIVTVHPDEVCAALSEAFEWGMTITEAKGYYSDSPKTVVYIVVNRFQVGKMKELVHENDRSAYISIAEIADVYGANTDKV